MIPRPRLLPRHGCEDSTLRQSQLMQVSHDAPESSSSSSARKANYAMGAVNNLPVKSKFTGEATQGYTDKMEVSHGATLYLDDTNSESVFGVYDDHEDLIFIRNFLDFKPSNGAEVASCCAKQFHIELGNDEDDNLTNAVERAFFRMDEKLQQHVDWRACDNRWIPSFKVGVSTDLWPFPQATYIEPAHERNTSCVLTGGNQIIFGNVGDSCCVLTSNGQDIDLSIDRKPVVQWGFNDFVGRVPFSRSIGDFAFKKNKDLPPEEKMVICNPDIHAVDTTGDTNSLVIEKSRSFIQFFVRVSRCNVSLYKHKRVRIREAVEEALAWRNERIVDSYIEYNNKTFIDDNDTLLSAGVMNNSHVYIKHRIRGGNSAIGVSFPAAIPLKAYVENQGYNKKEKLTRWFIERKLPTSLIGPDIDERGFFLNTSAKKCGTMLATTLENAHKCNKCFGGFEECDVLYDPLKDELAITVQATDFTPMAYKKDWKAYKKILQKYFRHPTPIGKLAYPMMVGDLVQGIDNLEGSDTAGILWKDRVLLYRHPCFKTDAEIIGIFFQLVLHYHTLEPEERKVFVSYFGRVLRWINHANKSRELKKLINFMVYDKMGKLKLHKIYDGDSGFSRFDMCRCAIQHVVRPGKVDVFVLLCFLWEDLVPHMIKSMLKYCPSEISEDPEKSQNHLKMVEILGFFEQGRDLC